MLGPECRRHGFCSRELQAPARNDDVSLVCLATPCGAARTKRVGQLSGREDALAVELLAIFLRYAGQQTEFVLFPRFRVAPSFELALAAMSVQHKAWRRISGQECGDLFDPLSYLTGEGGYLHPEHGVTVTMHDLAQSYLRPGFGQRSVSNAISSLCSFVSLLTNSKR